MLVEVEILKEGVLVELENIYKRFLVKNKLKSNETFRSDGTSESIFVGSVNTSTSLVKDSSLSANELHNLKCIMEAIIKKFRVGSGKVIRWRASGDNIWLTKYGLGVEVKAHTDSPKSPQIYIAL